MKLPELKQGELVTVANAPAFAAACAAYQEAQRAAAEAEDRAEAARAALELLLGDGTAAEAGGYRVYYRFTEPRRTLDLDALKAAHPSLDLEAYKKAGKPSRRLQVFNLEPDLDNPQF